MHSVPSFTIQWISLLQNSSFVGMLQLNRWWCCSLACLCCWFVRCLILLYTELKCLFFFHIVTYWCTCFWTSDFPKQKEPFVPSIHHLLLLNGHARKHHIHPIYTSTYPQHTHTHIWILSYGNSHQYCVTRQLLKELPDFLTLSHIIFLSVTFYLKNLNWHEVLIYIYLHYRRKEKISHCLTIADAMCHSGVKGASNFSQLLSIAIEVLLQLCDDCHSDVRMIADESLNRVIRVSRWTGFLLQGLSLGPELCKKMAEWWSYLWCSAVLQYSCLPNFNAVVPSSASYSRGASYNLST